MWTDQRARSGGWCRVAICGNFAARSARKRTVLRAVLENMPTARQVASFPEPLDHVIGVRIPASQPYLIP